MFSKRELRRRGASSRVIERIGQKQRGGRSGSTGFRQEDFFAVCKMLGATRRHLERGDLFWMIQNAEALVDDLVTGTYGFYQVKTSPRITWASLHTDFREQAQSYRFAIPLSIHRDFGIAHLSCSIRFGISGSLSMRGSSCSTIVAALRLGAPPDAERWSIADFFGA
jgi:hypothetical protein